jgi:hypothetical protein
VASTHPILVPLFPHTSQALFHRQFLAPVGHHEMVETLRGIIQHEGWHRVGITIISHSWAPSSARGSSKAWESWCADAASSIRVRTHTVSWHSLPLCALPEADTFRTLRPVCFQLWVPHVIE